MPQPKEWAPWLQPERSATKGSGAAGGSDAPTLPGSPQRPHSARASSSVRSLQPPTLTPRKGSDRSRRCFAVGASTGEVMPLYLGRIASPWRDDHAFAADFEPPRVPPSSLTPRTPPPPARGILRTGELSEQQQHYWGLLAQPRAGYSRDDESSGGSQKKTMEAVWRREKWLRENGYLDQRKPTAAQLAAWKPSVAQRKELPIAQHAARLRFFWKTGRPVPPNYLPKPKRGAEEEDDDYAPKTR